MNFEANYYFWSEIMDMDHIERKTLLQFIQLALKEDVGEGDHTSLATIPADAKGKAHLIMKESGVLAGIKVAQEVFSVVDSRVQVTPFFRDGQRVKVGDVILEVYGSVHSILMGERLVLNIMQRMSGIATVTSEVVRALSGTG